ncbi:MAG TPA: tetratricopeptide repeat protein, partial [Kofleriaceae bacterium]|nr:tetratricopeptide repeat protein [Kofleriaceae bacterium]
GCGSARPEAETAKPDRKPPAAKRDACPGGEALGCARLAERYERGDGVERDVERAVTLYERACRRELWTACTILGWLLEGGRGVPRDAQRASAVYQLACAGGEGVACSNLGLFYRDGEGVERSARRAATLFTRSCQLGHGTGCLHLAAVLETGETRDATSALFFRLKACLAGHKATCAALRRPPRSQRGGAGGREKRAAEACQRGDGKACVALGHLVLERGKGRRAERRAFAIYRKACDMSQAFGCLALARMFQEGRGVPPDRRRADHLRGRACSMDPLTCPRRGGGR